ncbi:TonB-dependent receptor [Filimonas lacunae]|uniref:TonB-dependent receptor n=1 Tax=Filimonas lacunae TaxID=477680 RepID=A0A173MFZ6_9BACT|nr:TonB-dependent receptor [Filimonas lacunae]BAV06515.1 TonB-dependent receptor [Filimonas lacunae]SIT27233.1 TonB-dependent receptor [Filimonas lacunae]
MKRLSILLLLITAIVFSAHAQKSSVSGKILDKNTGEPLAGSRIILQAPGQRHIEVAGFNGAFVIKNVTNTTYKVDVVFMGYKPYNTEITVNGSVNTLKIEMESVHNDLQTIEVSSRHDKGSANSAILADRKADVVQNSVAARTIELSPDLSVANVTQRVSGVSLERSTNGEGQYAIIRGMDKRYINTFINGVKIPSPDNKNRYVPLDVFPADLLDRLEVVKSLTPKQEGDAIGGAVNMVMKDAPEHLSVKANAAVGIADKFFTQDYTAFKSSPSLTTSPRLTNGDSYQATMNDFPNSAFSRYTKHNPLNSVLGASVGGRVFHDKLGIIVAGSYQNNYRNVNGYFFKSETDGNNGDAKVTDIQDRFYSIQQARSGLHTKLDYKINNNHKIRLYGAYMNLIKNEYRFSSDTNLILGRKEIGTGRISNNYRTYRDDQKIFNFTLSGSHKLTQRLEADWSAVYSKATDNRPDIANLNTNTSSLRDETTGNIYSTPVNFDLNSTRTFQHNSDQDKSGYLNLTYASTIGNAHVDWSTGGMYRSKDRKSDYDKYNLQFDPSNQIYDGDINHNTMVVNNTTGSYNDALNYSAKEKVGAAYGMVKISLKQLELVGGARYEHTSLSWSSNVPKSVDGKTGNIQYYDVLPSAMLKYGITNNQVVRLSYYSAISRPNFFEVIPHTDGNPDGDYPERGNSSLKRTTANNYDLRYEYYIGSGSQMLAGVFYKDINNPIEFSLQTLGNILYYIPSNFGRAKNYGFEFDVTHYLRQWGVRANYTYTHSAITTTKIQNYTTSTGTGTLPVNQTRPLQGQSAHVANVSLLFKDDNKLGLNAQLALGYTSKRINTVSQFLNNDIWQKAFTQLDFSLEKRVAKRWFVYTKINNILNTPYQLELQQPYTASGVTSSVPHQELGKKTQIRKDTYGANYLLGVRFKL